MEISALESKKNRLVLKVDGAEQGILNAIRKELWNDTSITAAGNYIEHPLVAIPEMTIETDSKGEAKKAFVSAIGRLQKQTEKLRASAKKAIK